MTIQLFQFLLATATFLSHPFSAPSTHYCRAWPVSRTPLARCAVTSPACICDTAIPPSPTPGSGVQGGGVSTAGIGRIWAESATSGLQQFTDTILQKQLSPLHLCGHVWMLLSVMAAFFVAWYRRSLVGVCGLSGALCWGVTGVPATGCAVLQSCGVFISAGKLLDF